MDLDRADELLKRYRLEKSEPAFRELVEGYAGLVFATALRRTSGNEAIAEDAAQLTFIALASQAASLRDGSHLAPWLHQTATRKAISLMRSETARQRRERENPAHPAMSDDSPVNRERQEALLALLDESLLALNYEDRRIIALRYLDGGDLKSISRVTGRSVEATGKRLQRALEKLRGQFTRRDPRGDISAAGLLTLMGSPPVRSLPTSATRRIAARAFAHAKFSSPLVSYLLVMTYSTKAWLAAGAVFAGCATVLALQHSRPDFDDRPVTTGEQGRPAAMDGMAEREGAEDIAAALRSARALCPDGAI